MNICKRVGSLMLSLLLVFSLLSSTLAVQTYAATVPELSAESKSVSPGEQFSITVNLANATSVYGGNFTLQYDSNLLTADSFTFGSIVGGHTKNCNLDYQSAGNLIRFTFSGASALTSSGTLVTFTFTAKQSVSGSAALKFTSYKMYDVNGSSITSMANGSTITISSKPVVSPSISITNKTVTVGETVSVPIMISNSSDVYGGNFTLQYDSNLLTAESYSFGSIVSGHTKNCNLNYQSAGNLIRVTFSGASAVSSDGTLVTFTFTAKAEGTAALQFIEYKMYDENGSSLDSTTNGATININKVEIISGYCGVNVTYSLNLSAKTITISGTGDMYDFNESNSAPWNTYKSYIQKVKIENGVTRIGNYAFGWNSGLSEVVISDTVESIGEWAFAWTGLTSLFIPASVFSVASYSSFVGTQQLQSITVDSENKVYESMQNCFIQKEIKTIVFGCKNSVIPDDRSVVAIGSNAFSSVQLPCDFVIPSSIISIGSQAFSYDYSITSIIVPSSVTDLERFAFSHCTNIEEARILCNISTIRNRLFYDCKNLKTVYLPGSIDIIESYAFDDCSSLETVYFDGTKEQWDNITIQTNNEVLLQANIVCTKTVSSISITNMPKKTQYYVGDKFDTIGLELKTTYTDGTTEVITSGFTTSGFSSTSAGTKTITVEYGGKTTTFTVTVNTPIVSLSSTSKSMTVGDTATLTATTTPSGQTVTWTSSNTSVATVSDGTITAKAAGTATITAKFTYNGITYRKNCSVTVASAPNPEPTLSSISIATKPTKTTYEIGESLNISGLTLKLTYSDGSTKTVSSGFTTSGFSSDTAGTKTVKVTYSGKSTNFTVIVNEPIIDQNKPCVTIERKNARVGSTVSITVNLQNNPGIWGMDLAVNYDKSQLTLTNVTNGTVFSSSEWMQGSLSGDKYILSYEASGFEDNTTNGVLATLEFTVNENATADSFSDISLSYNTGDIINVNFDDIEMSVVSGGINITDFIYGDLNGDGLVNKKDSLLMKMYLADNSTIIDKQAADVYADGIINKKDSLYLKQYLAGLDVELGA